MKNREIRTFHGFDLKGSLSNNYFVETLSGFNPTHQQFDLASTRIRI